MFFAGSFDPAYILTISAPREVLYCSNNLVAHRRNATQVMRHMEEALGVGCARGLVRFVPFPAEGLATGGDTLGAHVEGEVKRLGKEGRRGRGGKKLGLKVSGIVFFAHFFVRDCGWTLTKK